MGKSILRRFHASSRGLLKFYGGRDTVLEDIFLLLGNPVKDLWSETEILCDH
jgi:hypothetical protein